MWGKLVQNLTTLYTKTYSFTQCTSVVYRKGKCNTGFMSPFNISVKDGISGTVIPIVRESFCNKVQRNFRSYSSNLNSTIG